MRRIALVALLAAIWSSSVSADTYPRQPGVDAIHYVFRLTLLTDETNIIRGEATAIMKFAVDGVREVSLDLTSATSEGKGMTVQGVRLARQPLQFLHENDRLRITLPSPSKAGEEAAFTVAYRGVPDQGLRLIPNIHGDRTAFSENWPNRARQWLPMIDHPYDKATGELIVTTSNRYQVIANGVLMESLDMPDGLRRVHWKQNTPIASWLYAIGVAPFAIHHFGVVKGVPMAAWVFPQDRDRAFGDIELTGRQSLEFFSEHVGPYPYEKLHHVQAAGLGGATEHATAIFYGERGVNTRGFGAIVHETAHQWFGNSVTEKDWDDVWLSEGFATYFTLLYTEHYGGRDPFVAGLKRSRDSILQLEQRMPDTPVIHRNLSDMRRVLNQFVYQKGGWTLHMLRAQIGTVKFWEGIREYYRRYRDGNASTDDFRRVMEQAAGQDLAWFFSQWLNRSGVPKLTGSWRYDAAAKQVLVDLTQAQSGDPYRLPLEVGIVAAAGSLPRVEHAELTGRTGAFSFAADTEPVDVLLDPGTWLLMDPPEFRKR